MGICQFEDSIHHRIDIKYYPIHEYAFALLYFTGSGQFNRNLRIHAIKIGLQLSDTGVIAKADKNGTIWKKNIPTCYTEEDIFKLLGVEYKTPKQRDL
jgi:DNA polymerase lambda